jgi:PAS domain S-box-containing protein
MRRKTIIVLAITFMVATMVSAFSYLYIFQLIHLRLTTTSESTSRLAQQLAYAAENDVPDLSSTRLDTNDPVAVRRALAEFLPTDTNLQHNLDAAVGNWPFVYDACIVDADGRALLHTSADVQGKIVPVRQDLQVLLSAHFRDQLQRLYEPPGVYTVSFPLRLNGLPFGAIRIGVSTLLLRSEITPRLLHAAYLSVAAIFASLLLAAVISNFALGPLKQISRTLDSASAGHPAVIPDSSSGHDEYGLVTLKIASLGQQVRDTKEIFSVLKDNVDQLMAKLQDGLMLFSRDHRVVLVSAPVERFLGLPRSELLGRSVKDIFSRSTDLGALVLDAFERRRTIPQREIELQRGRRAHFALDFVEQEGSQIGALLIIRDTESVRRIEDEIELSRRLSASGRLTRGVAHEVKNPINAIVLHLQLLQNKLSQIDPDTHRHMDIIDSEIHRLDRVVQTLVDFMRPRELHLEALDLRRLLEEVATLAAPDAEHHGVTIRRVVSSETLPVRADADLMKQAILNVVINGIQAMPNGGNLTVSASRDEESVHLEIQDCGAGMPKDVQDKVFELYFTTKKSGTGIGLAETYKILQWHHGSVEFESVINKGTTFRLRLPLSPAGSDELPEDDARRELVG